MSEIMNDETLTALMGSITKWEAIADGTGVDIGRYNCPLCVAFSIDESPQCGLCPVMRHTGERNCLSTPYIRWIYHQNDVHDDADWHRVQCPECASIAREEVEFLKSLLPIREAEGS